MVQKSVWQFFVLFKQRAQLGTDARDDAVDLARDDERAQCNDRRGRQKDGPSEIDTRHAAHDFGDRRGQEPDVGPHDEVGMKFEPAFTRTSKENRQPKSFPLEFPSWYALCFFRKQCTG